MATRKETVKICDVCQKRVSDGGETPIGWHPHAGWFAIELHGGGVDPMSIEQQKRWDVCSVACLRKLAEQM